MAKNRRLRPVPEIIGPSGVGVFESHHDHDFYMEYRTHDFLKLLFIMAGSGHYQNETGKPTPFGMHDLIVVPIGQSHRIEDTPGDRVSLYMLCVLPPVWAVDEAVYERLPFGLVRSHEGLALTVRENLRRLLFEQTPGRVARDAVVVGTTLQLLSTLARHRAPAGNESDLAQRMSSYVDRLGEHFFEASTIDHAAADLSMSRRRFTQLFKEQTGMTWLAYVTKLRIDHAQTLLRDTSRTVTSIAFECGFEELSSFYRAFHKHVSQSPNTWRSDVK